MQRSRFGRGGGVKVQNLAPGEGEIDEQIVNKEEDECNDNSARHIKPPLGLGLKLSRQRVFPLDDFEHFAKNASLEGDFFAGFPPVWKEKIEK